MRSSDMYLKQNFTKKRNKNLKVVIFNCNTRPTDMNWKQVKLAAKRDGNVSWASGSNKHTVTGYV